MSATRRRLRGFVRLREAVAASEMPQLERGRDDELEERDYETEARIGMAHVGRAMPVRNDRGEITDGRYPIETRQDVRDAVDDADRSDADPTVRHHIIRNAQRVDAMDEIPDSWHPRAGGSKAGKSKRSKPKAKGKGKGKAARESVRFVARLHEANIAKRGSVYECTVLQEGPGNPADSNAYSKQALRKAVDVGLFDGLQAYANHPTPSEERERPERDVRHLVGHFREARFVDGNPAEVRAKFIPIEGDGYGWVQSLIESALGAPADKPLIGISIDGYGDAPDSTEINGRTYSVVREITHLGSADIVTRAGAGGRFHRKLSESLAGARAEIGDAPTLTAGKLQKHVQRALRELEAGLADEDDRMVQAAFVRLHGAASASIKVKKRVTASPASENKLREAARDLRKERKRRRLAEGRADLADRAKLAGRLLREVDVPPVTREAWFADLVDKRDEQAMRALLERRQTERREQTAELRESLGLDRIEGAPRREQTAPAGPTGPDLLERLGIDREELEV